MNENECDKNTKYERIIWSQHGHRLILLSKASVKRSFSVRKGYSAPNVIGKYYLCDWLICITRGIASLLSQQFFSWRVQKDLTRTRCVFNGFLPMLWPHYHRCQSDSDSEWECQVILKYQWSDPWLVNDSWVMSHLVTRSFTDWVTQWQSVTVSE